GGHPTGGTRRRTGDRRAPGGGQDTGSRRDPGDRHGSIFSRPPMAPLSTSDAQAPAGLPEQEETEDAGWGATFWDRPGPAGSMGSRRSGGGGRAMDHGLVKRLRGDVGDRLAEQRRPDAAARVAPRTREEERQAAPALTSHGRS